MSEHHWVLTWSVCYFVLCNVFTIKMKNAINIALMMLHFCVTSLKNLKSIMLCTNTLIHCRHRSHMWWHCGSSSWFILITILVWGSIPLLWVLTKAWAVKPQIFKWMHFCLLVLTSVFVDIFWAPWWLSWCFMLFCFLELASAGFWLGFPLFFATRIASHPIIFCFWGGCGRGLHDNTHQSCYFGYHTGL